MGAYSALTEPYTTHQANNVNCVLHLLWKELLSSLMASYPTSAAWPWAAGPSAGPSWLQNCPTPTDFFQKNSPANSAAVQK